MRSKLILLLCFFLSVTQVFSQIPGNEDNTASPTGDTALVALPGSSDTLRSKQIILTRKQAIDYLKNNFQTKASGKGAPEISSAIRHLVLEASNPPYDSTRRILEKLIKDTTEQTGKKGNIVVQI